MMGFSLYRNTASFFPNYVRQTWRGGNLGDSNGLCSVVLKFIDILYSGVFLRGWIFCWFGRNSCLLICLLSARYGAAWGRLDFRFKLEGERCLWVVLKGM